ncbi:MAG: chemotaxis protein CheW [Anaerolineae bacterium]|nr:chemotaxis protein CheW [Anaerolineae bacterium]
MSFYDHFSEEELAVLRNRAQHVAHAAREDQAKAFSITALLVTLHGESYALPLDMLSMVHQHVAVVPVPCTPPFVAGIANIRGHIVPVLDLSALLGVQDNNEITALVVIGNEDMSFALQVSSVGEVITLTLNSIREIPAALGLVRPGYIQGVFPDGTILLDINAILNDPALIIEETVD